MKNVFKVGPWSDKNGWIGIKRSKNIVLNNDDNSAVTMRILQYENGSQRASVNVYVNNVNRGYDYSRKVFDPNVVNVSYLEKDSEEVEELQTNNYEDVYQASFGAGSTVYMNRDQAENLVYQMKKLLDDPKTW